MNDGNITAKCSYCNNDVIYKKELYNEPDTVILKLMIKDNTVLCKSCVNDYKATMWLSNYIRNNR